MEFPPEQGKMFELHKRVVNLLVVTVLVIAILNILGWLFNFQPLKFSFNHYPAMRFNTSLGLIFLSVSLLTKDKFKANILSLIAFGIGAATLYQYFSYDNLGIDNFFAQSGKMALVAALFFTTTGLGVFIKNSTRKLSYIWQTLPLINLFLLTLAVCAFLFPAHSLEGIHLYADLSIPTTVCFIIINIALLMSEPEQGFMTTFSSVYAGGRMGRRLLPMSVIAL